MLRSHYCNNITLGRTIFYHTLNYLVRPKSNGRLILKVLYSNSDRSCRNYSLFCFHVVTTSYKDIQYIMMTFDHSFHWISDSDPWKSLPMVGLTTHDSNSVISSITRVSVAIIRTTAWGQIRVSLEAVGYETIYRIVYVRICEQNIV